VGRHTPWPTLDSSLPFTPICVSAFGPEEIVRPVAERLAEEPPEEAFVLQAGTHDFWCLEVHHTESGKHNAARRVLDHLGLARAESLALGDHLNDLALLEFAGVGIAMGNALPVVRARAGHVTATMEEEGVALAIERWVLGEASGS
jgi:hydroxymethylpyrimidine pyrophosphatase-like HAD family hydrolase